VGVENFSKALPLDNEHDEVDRNWQSTFAHTWVRGPDFDLACVVEAVHRDDAKFLEPPLSYNSLHDYCLWTGLARPRRKRQFELIPRDLRPAARATACSHFNITAVVFTPWGLPAAAKSIIGRGSSKSFQHLGCRSLHHGLCRLLQRASAAACCGSSIPFALSTPATSRMASKALP
jgi:hypothetical protein